MRWKLVFRTDIEGYNRQCPRHLRQCCTAVYLTTGLSKTAQACKITLERDSGLSLGLVWWKLVFMWNPFGTRLENVFWTGLEEVRLKHFPHYWKANHQSLVNIPHQRASNTELCFFSLTLAWISSWTISWYVNNSFLPLRPCPHLQLTTFASQNKTISTQI